MFAIVQSLGWPVWPLIIASIVALALIIERSTALRRARIAPPTLLQDVLALHAKRQITPEVIGRLEQNSPLGRILAAGLRNERAPRDIAVHAVESAGAHAAHELSRYLTLLGSIGSVAPLLGLFGTVVGIINAFKGIASQKATGLGAVAGGISEALVTTAIGLFVAVPAVWMYNYFTSRVEAFDVEMDNSSSELIDYFVKRSAAGSKK